MTISKRSLLAVATTTTALILTACVAPPAAKPTPGPTTTAVPAPVVPRLCSEIGEDPAGVLGSPLLQQVAPAARSASPPAGSDTEPLDPDELPEPLDPDGVRATAEWIANDSRDGTVPTSPARSQRYPTTRSEPPASLPASTSST